MDHKPPSLDCKMMAFRPQLFFCLLALALLLGPLGCKDANNVVSLYVTPREGSFSRTTDKIKQYTATATYTDGTTADLTDEVIWSLNDATADAAMWVSSVPGLVTLKYTGVYVISATYRKAKDSTTDSTSDVVDYTTLSITD